MLSSILRGNTDFISIIVYILSTAVVVFLTLPIHEFAHGFVADKLGDPTPRYQGRLSLNPLAHLDLVGSVCILLFGFGWAKPVGVNPNNFEKPKRDMALVALAGPASNLIVAFISLAIIKVLSAFTLILFLPYVITFLLYIAQINISLAVFNLIPVPPLDGSRILGIILPDRLYFKIMQYERYIYIGLMILLFTDVLDVPLFALRNLILSGFLRILNLA